MRDQVSSDKAAPMGNRPYIRASDIGTYMFCRRAWHLARIGAPSTLVAERERGIAFHQHHGEDAMRAQAQGGGRNWIWLAVAIILLLLGLAVLL